MVSVRNLKYKGWYFTNDSPQPNDHGSTSPTYPTHHNPNFNAKLQ